MANRLFPNNDKSVEKFFGEGYERKLQEIIKNEELSDRIYNKDESVVKEVLERLGRPDDSPSRKTA